MPQRPNEHNTDLSPRIDWHTLTIGKAFEILGSDPELGLKIDEALDRVRQYGKK